MSLAKYFLFVFVLFPSLPLPKESSLPNASFWSDYTLLFLACLLVFYYGVRQFFKKNDFIKLSWLGLFFAVLIALALLQFVLKKINSPQEIIVFSGIFLLLIGISSIFTVTDLETRKSLIHIMAQALVVGGLLQTLQVIAEVNGYTLVEWKWIIGDFPSGERPGGRFFQPNQMAAYIFLSVLSTCFLWAQRKIKAPQAVIILTLLMLALSLSKSRAVLIYVALIFPLYAFLIYKNEKNSNWQKPCWAIFLFCVTEMAVYFFYGQSHSLISRTANQFSLGVRLNLIQDAWRIFLQYPVLGVGLNQYGGARNLLYPEGIIDTPNAMHAHNMLFNLLAETGLLGTGVLVIFIGWSVKIIIKQGLGKESIYLLMSLFLIGLYSHSEYPLWVPFFLLFTTVCISLLLIEYAVKIKLNSIFLKLTSAVSVFFISVWLYAGYEYYRLENIHQKTWSNQPVNDEAFVEALDFWSKHYIWSLEIEKLLLVTGIEHPLYVGITTMTSQNVFKQFPFPEFAPGQAFILNTQNKKPEAQALINRTCRAFPYDCENVRQRYEYFVLNVE